MTPVSVEALLSMPLQEVAAYGAKHIASGRMAHSQASGGLHQRYAKYFVEENLYPNLYFRQFGNHQIAGKRADMNPHRAPELLFLEGLPIDEVIDAASWLQGIPAPGSGRTALMLQDGTVSKTIVGRAYDFYELAWEARLNVTLREPWTSRSGDVVKAERARHGARTTPGREPTRRLRSK